MGYDIYLNDPVTKEPIQFEKPHNIFGGMLTVNFTRAAVAYRDDAGVVLRSESTSMSLFCLDEHIWHQNAVEVRSEVQVARPLVFTNRVWLREREFNDDQQAQYIAGAVHALPHTPASEQNAVAAVFELLNRG